MLTLNMTKMSQLSLLVIVLPYLLYGFNGVDSANRMDGDAAPPPPPVVCAPAGCVNGTVLPGFPSNTTYEAFMGIPYAEPPIGPLRFSNPKPLAKWKEHLNATSPKPDCIQKNYFKTPSKINGSEDCLYLNIYRPIIPKSKVQLDVMVYIHGGGWFSGSAGPSITGPEYFMHKKTVILVTVAYRLGPFGFLSTHDKIMPGNFGLKDQNLALRWVQKNIAAFGGNPKWVTLFGHGAGAVSAHMHMLSKQSTGLFLKVIALSGTANVPYAITDNPLNQTRQLATYCNIKKAGELNTVNLTEALRALKAEDILNAADKLKDWHIDPLVNFRAVVEKPVLTTSFLTERPEKTQKAGTYRAVPLMLGSVPEEGAMRVASIYDDSKIRGEFNSRFPELLELLLEFPERFNATERKEKTDKVIDEYFGGFQELMPHTIQGFLNAITDRYFHNPLYNTMRDHVNVFAKFKTDPVKFPLRLHMFDYSGSNSYTKMYTNSTDPFAYGVVHSNDLLYLFRSPLLFPDLMFDDAEEDVMEKMVGYLIDFARTSKPAPIVKSCSSKTFFKPDCADNICEYVLFTTNSTKTGFTNKTITDFNVRRMHFWNNLLR